jgi:hypothetical protein
VAVLERGGEILEARFDGGIWIENRLDQLFGGLAGHHAKVGANLRAFALEAMALGAVCFEQFNAKFRVTPQLGDIGVTGEHFRAPSLFLGRESDGAIDDLDWLG